ncbi:dienelactone hydrolase [Sorangium cellulosum]|uniref:Dienelactone hydrolase n=1 Tax=Sorangium cellulosum TaxID=56 RepID=A0A2L0F5L1_SORCE|nr:dienelactone hydrolase family protein [Sorangium cellulosum]AUX46850.1 dienelactone hydrolase [Sorangium cellulosum]
MKLRPLHRRLVASLALALSAACSSAAPPPPAEAPPPAAAPAPAPADGADSPTGLLSEEDFKALHQLRSDKAPPARGQTVEVAGTKAYLSLPPGAKAPLPGLVVIHEWWGLNEHIKHWTDRLAEDGYAALAVDMYGGKVATTPDDAMTAMKAVDEAKGIETVRAAHRFLTTDARVAAPRTGSIGWCFGGAWSLKLAMNEPELDAAVIYYGRLVTDPAKLKAIKAPVLGVFGNQDKGIPPEVVNEFDKALHEAGVEHEVLRYEADHAFANPSGERYDTKAAADSWERVRKFLAAKLKGG